MQPIFLNKTTMNKNTCRDFLALTWKKNTGLLRIVLLLIGVVSVGYGLAQLVFVGWSMLAYAIGLTLMGGVAVFMGQWGYYTRLGRYTKSQMEVWKGPTLEKEVEFFEEDFQQTSRLGTLAFAYDKVDGLLENKNSFVVQMGGNALLISKAGFEVGDAESFGIFIKGKILKNKRK